MSEELVEITVRGWRVVKIEDQEGLLIYVDLTRERVRLYEGVDKDLLLRDLDSVGSVSGLISISIPLEKVLETLRPKGAPQCR